jgi:competence protein ComGC
MRNPTTQPQYEFTARTGALLAVFALLIVAAVSNFALLNKSAQQTEPEKIVAVVDNKLAALQHENQALKAALDQQRSANNVAAATAIAQVAQLQDGHRADLVRIRNAATAFPEFKTDAYRQAHETLITLLTELEHKWPPAPPALTSTSPK